MKNIIKIIITFSVVMASNLSQASGYSSSNSNNPTEEKSNTASNMIHAMTPNTASGYSSSGSHTNPSNYPFGYSSQPNTTSGYSSSGSHTNPSNYPFGYSSQPSNPPYPSGGSFTSHHSKYYSQPSQPASRHHRQINSANSYWINSINADTSRMMVGGRENGRPLLICRAHYQGEMHPGKLIKDRCHIGWGGREILLWNYELLEEQFSFHWKSNEWKWSISDSEYVEGGFEKYGAPLHICQAVYQGAYHPGEIVGDNCNISWGGREISLARYNILVQ